MKTLLERLTTAKRAWLDNEAKLYPVRTSEVIEELSVKTSILDISIGCAFKLMDMEPINIVKLSNFFEEEGK